MKRKRYILLVILLISVIGLLPLIAVFRYGMNYNKERAKLGIPLLGKDWDRTTLSISEINYTNPVGVRENRYHLKKRVQMDWLMNIEKESDYFIIEDKKLAIDAIYDFRNKEPWYIRYYDKNNTKTILSYSQFIDTLKKYNVNGN
mgnify:FL=1